MYQHKALAIKQRLKHKKSRKHLHVSNNYATFAPDFAAIAQW